MMSSYTHFFLVNKYELIKFSLFVFLQKTANLFFIHLKHSIVYILSLLVDIYSRSC